MCRLKKAGPSAGSAAIAARLISVCPVSDHAAIARGAASARTAATATVNLVIWSRLAPIDLRLNDPMAIK
jgi:hypothetical protein